MNKYAIKNKFVNIERKCRDKKNKTCLYPGCERQPIRGHSIQEANLELIARDGKLMSMNVPLGKSRSRSYFRFKLEEIGKNPASMFKGFCSEHDDDVFKPIEDNRVYTNTSIQNFLFAYRACAYSYTKWVEQVCILQEHIQELEKKSADVSLSLGSVRDSMEKKKHR